MSLIEEAEAMGLVKRKPFAGRPEYFTYPFDCNYDDLEWEKWLASRWYLNRSLENGDYGSKVQEDGRPTWESARYYHAKNKHDSWQDKRWFREVNPRCPNLTASGALHINGCPDPRDIRYTPWTDCPECLKCGTGTMIIPDRYQAACRVLQCAACGTERIGTPLEWEHAKRAEVAWENELERQAVEAADKRELERMENHPWNKTNKKHTK